MSKDRFKRRFDEIHIGGKQSPEDVRFYELIREAIEKAYSMDLGEDAPFPQMCVFIEGVFHVGYNMTLTTDPEEFFDLTEEKIGGLGDLH